MIQKELENSDPIMTEIFRDRIQLESIFTTKANF